MPYKLILAMLLFFASNTSYGNWLLYNCNTAFLQYCKDNSSKGPSCRVTTAAEVESHYFGCGPSYTAVVNWYGTGEPVCPGGLDWDPLAQACKDPPPPEAVTVYCEAYGAEISENVSCPTQEQLDTGCPGGTTSCGLSWDYLTDIYNNDALNAAQNEFDFQVAAGQTAEAARRKASGASAGSATNSATGSTAGNSLTTEQKQELSDLAKTEGETEGSDKYDVMNSVTNKCLSYGVDIDSCSEIGLASSIGWETGNSQGAALERQANQGAEIATIGNDCNAAGQCDSYVMIGCNPPLKWNGSSTDPRCVLDPNMETNDCNVFNNYCQNNSCLRENQVLNPSTGMCETQIAVTSCPAGTTKDISTGECKNESLNPGCRPPYTYNGFQCALNQQVTTTVTEGNTTTTTTYNTNNTSEGTGTETAPQEQDGACDPTAVNYLTCIGEIVESPDNTADNITSGMDEKVSSTVSAIDQQYSDHLGGVEDNVIGIESGIFDDIFPSFAPTSACPGGSIDTIVNGYVLPLDCSKINDFKSVIGWFLYISTFFAIIEIAFRRPV